MHIADGVLEVLFSLDTPELVLVVRLFISTGTLRKAEQSDKQPAGKR